MKVYEVIHYDADLEFEHVSVYADKRLAMNRALYLVQRSEEEEQCSWDHEELGIDDDVVLNGVVTDLWTCDEDESDIRIVEVDVYQTDMK